MKKTCDIADLLSILTSLWLLWASNVLALSEPTVFSYSGSSEVLRDQVELEIEVPILARSFNATARVGQLVTIRFSSAESLDRVRTFGFVLLPEFPLAQVAREQAAQEELSRSQVYFTIVQVCLDERNAGRTVEVRKFRVENGDGRGSFEQRSRLWRDLLGFK